jgi:hypothetical protein
VDGERHREERSTSSGEAQPNPDLDRLLDKGRGFNENFNRKPVGWAVLLVVLIFFFLAWIFIELA